MKRRDGETEKWIVG